MWVSLWKWWLPNNRHFTAGIDDYPTGQSLDKFIFYVGPIFWDRPGQPPVIWEQHGGKSSTTRGMKWQNRDQNWGMKDFSSDFGVVLSPNRSPKRRVERDVGGHLTQTPLVFANFTCLSTLWSLNITKKVKSSNRIGHVWPWHAMALYVTLLQSIYVLLGSECLRVFDHSQSVIEPFNGTLLKTPNIKLRYPQHKSSLHVIILFMNLGHFSRLWSDRDGILLSNPKWLDDPQTWSQIFN